MRGAALLLAMAATAAAARPDRDSAALTAGRTPQPPVDCISGTTTTSQATLDGIASWRDGALVWLNRFNGQCRFLHEGDGLVIRSFGGQLCRGDVATARDPVSGIERGPCVLGPFEPYRRRPAARSPGGR